MSKAVVVGDLNVGKTCLINRSVILSAEMKCVVMWKGIGCSLCFLDHKCFRFCKDAFDRDYKATIGVDFEIERFEICGLPFSLQM